MLDHLHEEDPKCVDDAEDDSIYQEAADHYEPGLGEKYRPSHKLTFMGTLQVRTK